MSFYQTNIKENTLSCMAFNVWSVESARAVVSAFAGINQSVILQTSQSVFESFDVRNFRLNVSDIAKKFNVDVILHLDHCRSLNTLKIAVDEGWDSVMMDASHESLEKNIQFTNEATVYAHSRNVLIEAEVGAIFGVEDDIIVSTEKTANSLDVKKFLSETNVDMLAVAVGTAHGIYKDTPSIEYGLISELQSFMNIPLVIHGCSGLTDETILKLLSYPIIKKLNFSTDVKLSLIKGINSAHEVSLGNTNPLKLERLIFLEITNMVKNKLELLDKAEKNCVRIGG